MKTRKNPVSLSRVLWYFLSHQIVTSCLRLVLQGAPDSPSARLQRVEEVKPLKHRKALPVRVLICFQKLVQKLPNNQCQRKTLFSPSVREAVGPMGFSFLTQFKDLKNQFNLVQ